MSAAQQIASVRGATSMTPQNRSGKPGVNIHRNYMHKPLRAIWAVTIGQPVSCPRDLIERLGR
jgi:hypothetical protein